ncbi:MAG: oligopeptide transporter, OPT family, partial [Myxococcales bacterium]|nr:oligopeptide transporter, OPT family [Myxococcales bacterium]
RGEVERTGLLAAAGFITGEALLGIGLAVPVALRHDENAIALFGGAYKGITTPALVFVGIVLVLLYKLALRKSDKPV